MSYAFPPTAKDECLLDIYDIFGTYWEGSGNGDGSDSDDGAVPANPPPMLAIEDGVVDVEASPRASGGSSGSVPIADEGYGGLVSHALSPCLARLSQSLPRLLRLVGPGHRRQMAQKP